jgi:N-dimethylarginine dimethylaminohydrolase
MSWTSGALSEVGRLEEIVVVHAAVAFENEARIAREWRDLGFTAAPDFRRAVAEYDAFLDLLSSTGAQVRQVPRATDVGLDSLYARDASIVTAGGLLLCRMGKAKRSGEPAAQGRAYSAWGVPVVGTVDPPGQIEGGDLVWLDDDTVVVGRGYRTNDDGIAQFRRRLPRGVTCHVVPLPHWRGPGDVFHLMSILSPVDRDLAVVYSPLMPVPFREALLARGIRLVEVPDEEFESMGANVLALGPRDCLMLEGNPITRQRLEAAGAAVRVYSGSEISLKGGGGPTCLTRPIRRGPLTV